MNSSKSESPVKRWSPDQRQELLRRYRLKAGSVTQLQFCRENNLGLSTLSLWLRQSRRARFSSKASEPGFIPVQIFPQQGEATLELLLPEIGSLKLHGNFDAVQVASLVKALRQ